MKLKDSPGLALISIIISLLIAAIIIYAMITLYTGGKTDEGEHLQGPIDRSKAVQCLAQIRMIETSVQMSLAEHGSYPSSLSELRDISESDLYCPVTGNHYNYDSRTGRVTCPDH
jgi:hypothetical protein